MNHDVGMGGGGSMFVTIKLRVMGDVCLIFNRPLALPSPPRRQASEHMSHHMPALARLLGARGGVTARAEGARTSGHPVKYCIKHAGVHRLQVSGLWFSTYHAHGHKA